MLSQISKTATVTKCYNLLKMPSLKVVTRNMRTEYGSRAKGMEPYNGITKLTL